MGLRNRIAHVSMTTMLATGGRVTDRLIQYHANRASGGAAMTITEPLGTAPHQATLPRVQVWNDSDSDALKRWADAVETQDCRLIGQIQDAGRGRHAPGRNPEAIGASARPDDLSWTMPHVLTTDEIFSLVANIAQSAQRLQRCGWSGTEISAGHGHLFHQFLSPWSNVRTDAYGGDWHARARIVVELVAEIRALCGPRFIIGLKLPVDDGVPNSIGPAEAAIVADILTTGKNVDYVCFAGGAHARTLEMHVPDRYGPPMPYMPVIKKLRHATNGVPVMALGRITDPAEADGILARGEAALIGLGRPLVADPAWPRKTANGRVWDIRYCLSCNTCWGAIVMQHRAIACVNNPRVALPDEVDFWPQRTTTPKRIIVVGAGIAGMEAAWVAAARGHQVTLFGRSPEPGGKARLRALLPGGETISSIYDYQTGAAHRAGVDLELGVTANLENIMARQPDAVILATGSTMLSPDWLPASVQSENLVPNLRDAMQEIIRHTQRQPGTAVIFDMDHTEATYAAAEALHARFSRVVIITPRDTIATDVQMVTRQGIFRRMADKRITTIPLAEPRWSAACEDGKLEYANVYNGDTGVIEDVAFLTYATPRVPNDALVAPLRAAGVAVHLVGDCLSPQELLSATATGHAVGCAV